MNTSRFIFLALFILSISALAVYAVPIGPDTLTPTVKGSRSAMTTKNTSALAGNITELIINGTAITQAWQGYFGNVSGQIVLDDSNNKSMYVWTDLSPSGEIYATRASGAITWASINCSNSTNVAAEETAISIGASDKDGVNETFNLTQTGSFTVGNVTITGCAYSQYLYENDAPAASSNFQEVLLHDGTNMVYTGIINQDKTGYDNAAHDFQLMVAENGHNGDTSTTPYYFYVELN